MAVDEQSLETLRRCQEDRSLVLFSGDGLDIVFQTQVLEVDREFITIANNVPPRFIASIVESDSFGLQSKMTRFTSTKIDTDGEHILFPLSDLQEIEETRQAERFPFEADERVVCELVNSYDGETVLSKTVLDMSATGLSIRSPRTSQLFTPGTYFKTMRVMIDGEPYTKSSGTVVYNRKLMEPSGKIRFQVGIKFEPAVSK